MNKKHLNISSIALILLSTFFWGAGFVFVKWLKPFLNPFESNHFRFYLAALIVLPYIVYKRFSTKINQSVLTPAIASVYIYLMLTLQTWGLYYTSVAKAGFLTTLYVVIIPFLLWILEKKKFNFFFIFCCLISILGIFFLNNSNFSEWNIGDTFILICAIFAAIHILYIEKKQKNIINPFLFNAEQCFFLAVLGLMLSFMHDDHLIIRINQFNPEAWLGLLGLSILSSIIAFSFQVYAQRNIPSHIIGILFLLESPFAAILAYFYLGEKLQTMATFGALLVVLSSILVIINFKNK